MIHIQIFPQRICQFIILRFLKDCIVHHFTGVARNPLPLCQRRNDFSRNSVFVKDPVQIGTVHVPFGKYDRKLILRSFPASFRVSHMDLIAPCLFPGKPGKHA